MVLAAGDKTMFYGSKNLKRMGLLSDFGRKLIDSWRCLGMP
jgi:levanase/fructan beta-fructosidase